MSFVGIAAVAIGVALLVWVTARLTGWRIQAARRDHARRLQGTARLHALAAEERREAAIEAADHAGSASELQLATEARRRAEAELEEANREAKRARALDPDADDPDPNLPRID